MPLLDDAHAERPMKQPTRRPSYDLSGKQRRHLRGLAHSLSPIVHIGKEGLSSGSIASIREALKAHELIKIRVLESAPQAKAELAPLIAERTGAHLVGVVGHLIILYRMHDERPTIELPKKGV